MLSEENRDSGISLLGKIPWGSHICQFYRTENDLFDILIPYFKTGLENNEYCIWITSDPLNPEKVKAEFLKKHPDFKNYFKKKQIEIFPHTQWYLKDGVFETKRILKNWHTKLDEALKNGYDGLRATGSNFWLKEKDWGKFIDYEEKSNKVIGNFKMIALCAYSLEKCSGEKIISIVCNHQKAIVKRDNNWNIIQNAELKKKEELLQKSEANKRAKAVELQAIIEAVPAAVWIAHDSECKVITGNKTSYEILRLKSGLNASKSASKDQIPNTFFMSRDGKKMNPEEMPMQRAARGEIVKDNYFDVIFEDNTKIHLYGNAVPLLNEDGKPKGSVGVFIDITGLKKKEKEIKHLASFPHLNIMPIVELDNKGKVVYSNPAMMNLFPDIEKKAIKHPLIKDINFNLIKKNSLVIRELQICNKWFKQNIHYILESDTIRIYNSDITDLKKIEEKLRNFLAILGHELRNPLSSIILLTDLLEPKINSDCDFRKNFFQLKHQVKNMSGLLKNLLDISRIELGKINIRKKEINLTSIIREIAETFKPILEKNNQKLEMVIPNESIFIMADCLRIEQIIFNLLNNASKFSYKNSLIKLSLEKNNDDAVIRIKDFGMGISLNSLSKIFDLFAQENTLDNIKNEGFGIGLYLSKQLANLYSGEINVYSDGFKKGSEFVVIFPLKNKSEFNIKQKKKKKSEKSSKIKILIVDDNVVLCEALEESLKKLGYETKISNEGKKALKIIEDFKPDIMVIDLGMPEMDGLTLAKKIRKNKKFFKTILIAITGYGQEMDKKMAQKAGFNNYVIKPISALDLSKMFSKEIKKLRD
jgi:signal transduction histidine kinase/ActR/RegA family two-component response regulator/PAS domain-containing protein